MPPHSRFRRRPITTPAVMPPIRFCLRHREVRRPRRVHQCRGARDDRLADRLSEHRTAAAPGRYRLWRGNRNRVARSSVDLPRFRGEMRAWDQALWLCVMLSSGFVAFFSSTPAELFFRPDPRTDGAAARSGGQGRPLAGLVLDGREHGGRLVCVAIDGCCMMPVFIVNRREVSDR